MSTKGVLFLLVGLLLLMCLFQVKTVSALSAGYERYKDSICEIYLEYFPLFPVDTENPTASEEFAIKFYIVQETFSNLPFEKYVADGFLIRVGFRDVTDGSLDWTTWKRWYPLSVQQHGIRISWSLSAGYKSMSIGATVAVPDLDHVTTDYTQQEWEYNGITYMYLTKLDVYYNSNTFWGQTYCEGGGSIGIPNDLAMSKQGHHVEVLVQAKLYWVNYVLVPNVWERTVYFILGDDNPSGNDCWLNVGEGSTDFVETPVTLRKGDRYFFGFCMVY